MADYAAAKRARDDARTAADRAHHQALTATENLIALLGDSERPLLDGSTAYKIALAAWRSGTSPISDSVTGPLGVLVDALDRIIAEIADKQGDHTYARAKAKIDRILELAEERDVATRTGVRAGEALGRFDDPGGVRVRRDPLEDAGAARYASGRR